MSPSSHAAEYAQSQARRAWQWVTDADKESEKTKDRYATLARKLPSYLQVSGLGQTMAFLYSKDDGGAQLLFNQLGEYLRASSVHSDERANAAKSQRNNHIEWLVNRSPDEYRRLTREAVVIADWVKRFAAGRLGLGSDE